MKEQLKLLTVLLLLILISICCSFIEMKFIPLFVINDNQRVYLYSAGAQVLAGLFGIIIAAYVFFIDKMNKEVVNDESFFDVVEDIKLKNYYQIVHMGVILFITILCCFLNIIIEVGDMTFGMTFIKFFGVILLVYELGYVITFAISVVEPRKIEKVSQKLKNEEDMKECAENKTVDLIDFLKAYNILEMVVTDAASYLDGWSEQWAGQNNRPPQMRSALQFLVQKKVLTKEEADRINEVRRYRNLTVHSISPETVSMGMYDELSIITEKIKRIMKIIKTVKKNDTHKEI